MASNPSQLFLLADHLKLSLLERQRAESLSLSPTKQDAHISRSLESLREGLQALEAQHSDDDGMADDISRLRGQYETLNEQYSDLTESDPLSDPTITSPNDPSLSPDFAAAQSRPRPVKASSFRRENNRELSKSVRFTDDPSADLEAQNGNDGMEPYRDDPEDERIDQSELSNQQIHAYHSQVMQDQDEQLDRLGVSIGRQRELSMQIGDELDEQVAMLDVVDEATDRHTTQIDSARKRLGDFARKAKDNWTITTIAILIIILVLLIILTR